MPILEAVGRELVLNGRAVTRREIEARVPPAVLSTVPRLFDVLRDVQARLESEVYADGNPSNAVARRTITLMTDDMFMGIEAVGTF